MKATHFKIWDDKEKAYVCDYANGCHRKFDTESGANNYIDENLLDCYIDEPLSVFVIKEIFNH